MTVNELAGLGILGSTRPAVSIKKMASNGRDQSDYHRQRKNALDAARGNVRSGIENTILAVINSVVEGKLPVLEHLRVLKGSGFLKAKTPRSNFSNVDVVTDHENDPNAIRHKDPQTVIRFGTKTSQKKFTLLVHLMSKVYGMIQQGQTCTKRELYYENVSLYGSQAKLDGGLHDLCLILKVPRDALCVEATSKGLIAGDLSFINATGDKIDVGSHRSGLLVPSCVSGLTDFESKAQYILVVEKDTIFQRLLGEKIFDCLGPLILITGKGYPDFATQKIVKKLSTTLKLKVFALVDCDPHGIEIAAIYRWGSYAQANLSKCTSNGDFADMNVPDLIWLGMKPSDVLTLNLPNNASVNMSDKDRRKLEFVERRILLKNDPQWIEEVNSLKNMPIKAELEALFSCPRFFIEIFLKKKLEFYLQG